MQGRPLVISETDLRQSREECADPSASGFIHHSGWKSLQARASPSKALFQSAQDTGTPRPRDLRTLLSKEPRTLLSKGARTLLSASGSTALPAHCQPLTRDMVRHDLDKLESLGFFGRCRYSTGPCGGYTAYSFRHPQRADLIAFPAIVYK